MFAGLRKPTALIVIVVTLLAYGCPVQAIVHAFGVDERTVASWRERAGKHCEQVHRALVEQGKLDLVHVQADEIRVKGHKMIAWMGLALMVSTRLWLAGTVSVTRDRMLAERLIQQVRACAAAMRPLLVCTDGWAAYPGSIRRAFREKVKARAGRGRAHLCGWPQLHIGTVIKHTVKYRLTAITRRMAHGSLQEAAILLRRSRGGSMLNTAFIERFNGTMRERLATLTRKCRHAARRVEALHTGMYPALHDLQLLLGAPGTQFDPRCGQWETAGWTRALSSNGCWPDGSSVEPAGTPQLQGGSRSLGRTETSRPPAHSTSSRPYRS